MEMLIFEMCILQNINRYCLIEIVHDGEKTYLLFEPAQKDLIFLEDTGLTVVLKDNEYQLRTLLHNKRSDTYFIGFRLRFVLRPGKDVAGYNDRSKIVVLDKRDDRYESHVLSEGIECIDKLYTDASFSERLQNGGIAVIHENLKGDYQLYRGLEMGTSSNMMELLATIMGLEVLKTVKYIRIITDSQYVRKGVTEWVFNWKLNDWMTVNGEKVKNIEIWRRFDELSDGKYIEFQWVKGHTNHFENTLCDLYAREAAKGVIK